MDSQGVNCTRIKMPELFRIIIAHANIDTIMQHFSDCDGSAIFRVSSNNCRIWPNSRLNPMQFDVRQVRSFYLFWWQSIP
jgi:hypothetical protein